MKQLVVACLMLLCLFAAPALAAPEIQRVTLSENREAWLIENHALPIISVAIALPNAGTMTDPVGKEGRAVFASKLMMEGAGEYDALTFQERMDAHAIGMSLSPGTDHYTITLTALKEHWPVAIEALKLVLSEPRFEAADADRIRQEMLSTLRRLEESPEYLLGRAFEAAAFSGHPYAKPGRGTATSLPALSVEDASIYLREVLQADKPVIAVAGDITPAAVRRDLGPALQMLRGTEALPEVPATTLPKTPEPVHVTRAIAQAQALLALPGVARDDPDFYTAYLLDHILGGGLSGRLSSSLRQEGGLVYYAGSHLQNLEAAPLWVMSFATRPEKLDESFTRARRVLQRLAEEGVTDEELQEARQYLIGSFPLSMDRRDALARWLLTMQLQDLGIDYLEKRNDYIRAIRKEDVQRVARRYLGATPLQVSVGP